MRHELIRDTWHRGVRSHMQGLTGKVKMSWAMEPAAASMARRQCFNSASRRNLMSKRVEKPAENLSLLEPKEYRAWVGRRISRPFLKSRCKGRRIISSREGTHRGDRSQHSRPCQQGESVTRMRKTASLSFWRVMQCMMLVLGQRAKTCNRCHRLAGRHQ